MLEAIIEPHSFLPLVRWLHQFHHHFPCSSLWVFDSRADVLHRKGIVHCLLWAEYIYCYWLTLTIGVHQFFELGGVLYLEEYLLTILSYYKSTWDLTLRLSCSAAGALVIFYKLIIKHTINFAINLQNMPPKERFCIQIQYSSEITPEPTTQQTSMIEK